MYDLGGDQVHDRLLIFAVGKLLNRSTHSESALTADQQ